MRHTIQILILTVACALIGPLPAAEARQPRYRIYAPTPVYYSGVRVSPGVYVYPQVATTPRYYPVYPYSYDYPYPTGWYGGYRYNPGAFYYSYSPGRSSYYYINPSFSYWYRIR